MRIFDINDNEINESDVNAELGYLRPDKKFVKHHEAVEKIEEQSHYQVKIFYFEDNTSMKITDPKDPHVEVVDDQQGIFGYINLDGEQKKEFRGADIDKVVDVEAVEAAEAYDEYEDISRYVLYTAEELEKRRLEKEKAEKQVVFLETGLERLDKTEVSVDDLTLMLAEIITA